MNDKIIERPGYWIGDERHDTLAEAEAAVRLAELKRKAERFAGSDPDDPSATPNQRAIARSVNLIIRWELWLEAQRNLEEVNP